MTKPDLSSVTMFCAECVDVERLVPIFNQCAELCNFGEIKLLTSFETDYPHKVTIPHLPTHVAYSVFMLKRASHYLSTKHMLVVQHDGWIINPQAWDPAWLEYDYIGPLFIHRHVIGPGSVGSGGFSLRSKALMDYVNAALPEWTETPEGTTSLQNRLGAYEDGVISINLRHQLMREGFKFAPPEVAVQFAQGGNCDPAYYVERPFGFHGLWPNIDRQTGFVHPWPPGGP